MNESTNKLLNFNAFDHLRFFLMHRKNNNKKHRTWSLSLVSVLTGRTMGTDWLTGSCPSRSTPKCWHCRNSRSRMNPFNGVAHPSDSTWSHWRSSCDEIKGVICLYFNSWLLFWVWIAMSVGCKNKDYSG